MNSLSEKIYDLYGLSGTIKVFSKRIFFRKNYIIDCNEGRKYLVKSFSDKNYNQLLKLEYLSEINSYGGKVQSAVSNFEDKKYFSFENTYYVVFEFIHGKQFNVNYDDFYKLGNSVKELHDLFKNKNPGGNIGIENKLALGIEKYRRVIKKNNFSMFNTYGKDVKKKANDILSFWEHEFSKKERQFIHGDFNINNIIVNQSQYYFIDFDDSRIGDIYEDIATFLISLYMTSEDRNIFKIHYREFLNGYFKNYDEWIIEKIKITMKFIALKEICKHIDNYEFLIRIPNTKWYLDSLFNIFIGETIIDGEIDG